MIALGLLLWLHAKYYYTSITLHFIIKIFFKFHISFYIIFPQYRNKNLHCENSIKIIWGLPVFSSYYSIQYIPLWFITISYSLLVIVSFQSIVTILWKNRASQVVLAETYDVFQYIAEFQNGRTHELCH